MMKRSMATGFFAVTLLAAFGVIACGKNISNNKQEPVLADTAQAVSNDDQLQDIMTYMSPDGYQIKYDPKLFESNEIDEHTQSFVYIGECAGANLVTVYYKEGFSPEEVLYETTKSWGDQEKILRTQSWFPGTDDKWGFTRTMEAQGPAGSTIDNVAIAGEYNGGTLMFEIFGHRNDDEEMSMAVSDAISNLINSITYDNFEDQEMFSYYPGTYRDVKNSAYSIELDEDHFGFLHFQDDVQIIWGSDYVMTTDGMNKYEITLEGDNLYLRDEQFDDFREYTKAEIPEDFDDEAPAYSYSGDNEIERAIFNYMSDEIGSQYAPAQTKIPFMRIVYFDESIDNYVNVFGEFWVNGYNREKDTLVCENGGQHVGCFHLQKNDDGTYTVKEFEQTTDGSQFIPSAKKIFGEYYSALEKIMSDDEGREEVRKDSLRKYVTANNLSITMYLDYGWEAEQIFD